jgi:TRAP-type C4-dicarboxylate transport system substrate-binding protein
MKKLLSLSAAAITGCMLLTSTHIMAAEVTLNALTFAPKKAGISRGFRMFIKDVNNKFAGEFKINWRGGPEIMKSFGHAGAVRKGAIDMTFTSPSYYQGLVSASPTMNFSFKNYNEIAATGYYEKMTELHAKRGLIFLGELPSSKGRFHIFLAKPIKTLADLKGRRIRVFPTLLPLIKAVGATPLVLPIGAIYTAMERGTIDGFVRGKTGWPKQFKGVVHYIVRPGVYRAGFPILINPKAWSKVNPVLQKRITQYVRNDLAPRIDKSWDDYHALGEKQMKAAGFKTIELNAADRKKFLKLAIDSAWGALAKKMDKKLAAELRGMLVGK